MVFKDVDRIMGPRMQSSGKLLCTGNESSGSIKVGEFD
jgi:hypothetical protein